MTSPKDIVQRLDTSLFAEAQSKDEQIEIEPGSPASYLPKILKAYIADPNILADFPAHPPLPLTPKKAKQTYHVASDAETAIKASEVEVEVFYRKWSEKLGIPLTRELLNQQITMTQLESSFPGIIDALPMLFIESDTTYLKIFLLKLKEATRVENFIGPRARKAIADFAVQHPELPTVPINLNLEEYTASNDSGAEVQLGDGFNLPFQDASGKYRAVIKLKLEKQLVDSLSSGQELPYNVKFFSEENVDPKYYPYLLDVIFIHEYAHAMLNTVVGEEIAISYLTHPHDNLAHSIAEGFTVSVEMAYAYDKYQEALVKKDTIAADAFLFAIRARMKALRGNKNRYYFGRKVLAQAWRHSGKPLEELFQVLPQIDFNKASEIDISSLEFAEIAQDPLKRIPLKTTNPRSD